jgi:hypothetical protein
MACIALSKWSEISGNNLPHRFKVHFKVVVHQDVPHAGYGRPVDLGVPMLARIANPLRGRPHPCRLRSLRLFCECTQRHARHTLAGITMVRIPAERRHESEDSVSVESPPAHAGPGFVRDRRSSSPETWRGIAGHVDKQVHITLRRIFPASHRAKQADITRSVEGGDPQDIVTMFSYAERHPSHSLLYRLARDLDQD